MAVRAPFVPGPIIGCCLLPLLSPALQPLHRDVQIPRGAKLAVQPLQFILYWRPPGIVDHRREEQDGCAQSSERKAHLMQGFRIASACRLLTCSQIPEVAARYNSKCCVGRHHWIQRRGGGAVVSFGTPGGFVGGGWEGGDFPFPG